MSSQLNYANSYGLQLNTASRHNPPLLLLGGQSSSAIHSVDWLCLMLDLNGRTTPLSLSAWKEMFPDVNMQMCFLLSKLHSAVGTHWKKSCLFGFTSEVNVGHFFFDKALSPCFLPVGNVVHAQEKWLTASLPFVLDVTSTVPPSFGFIFLLQIYVWAMLSVSFTAVTPPPPLLLLLIFPRQSTPVILFFFSWLTHLHWRSGSWRKRWSRPL